MVCFFIVKLIVTGVSAPGSSSDHGPGLASSIVTWAFKGKQKSEEDFTVAEWELKRLKIQECLSQAICGPSWAVPAQCSGGEKRVKNPPCRHCPWEACIWREYFPSTPSAAVSEDGRENSEGMK